MELIQIIESTVFIFSLGLVVLLVLSYLLFKVKNYTGSFPGQKKLFDDDVSIIYEQPALNEVKDNSDKNKINKRFIVINETLRESTTENEINKKQEVSVRYYIYKPGRTGIAKELGLSRIKDY